MNRFTKHDYEHDLFRDICKLQDLENVEEEIGIDLTVLFTALKNGVYYFDEQGQLIHDYVWLVNDYIAEGVPDKLSFSFKRFSVLETLSARFSIFESCTSCFISTSN